ncbi:MAG TPA: DNA polymerase ligase N-terminal domain-containing protein [Nevskiaceae bacterium]|nr:DNA polymerase ligase N-terminal domain-containing protein [Nevskiaceae bacterium]
MATTRLTKYRRMRDFGATPEPSGGTRPAAAARAKFVVQLHFASHRHFDFRLQVGGTLRSWAVPKGPSLDPKIKRLAMEVEDHPLEYGGFEGTIPEGHYGAGVVHIWDNGTWRPEDDPVKALKDGHLDFELFGKRLRGRWTLIRTKAPKRPTWLLFKRTDEFVVPAFVADDTPLKKWRASPRQRAAPKATRHAAKRR